MCKFGWTHGSIAERLSNSQGGSGKTHNTSLRENLLSDEYEAVDRIPLADDGRIIREDFFNEAHF